MPLIPPLALGKSGWRTSFAAGRHKWKWGLLLPGAPEPRLTLLRRQGFRSVFQTALRGLSNRSIVVVGNYEDGPITAEPCRAKARPLRPRRSCFAPAGTQHAGGLGWRRRVLPPGPKGLLRRPFIAISGLRRHPQYRPGRLTKKERSRLPAGRVCEIRAGIHSCPPLHPAQSAGSRFPELIPVGHPVACGSELPFRMQSRACRP